jgi:hypothetical protein
MSITANIHYKSYNILNYKLVPPSIFVVLGAAKLVRARNDDHKRKLESCLLGMEMKRQAKSRAGESSRRLRRTATALERGSQRGQIIKKKKKEAVCNPDHSISSPKQTTQSLRDAYSAHDMLF